MRATLCGLLISAACGGGRPPASGAPGADLGGFAVERILVDGAPFEAWIADTPGLQAQGLMNATAGQLAPLPDGTPRGMLFVFPGPSFLSFWMRDTYVPLDLAYADAAGIVVEVHALVPLDETPVVAGVPVQFALEAPAGSFAARGITVGSTIVR